MGARNVDAGNLGEFISSMLMNTTRNGEVTGEAWS